MEKELERPLILQHSKSKKCIKFKKMHTYDTFDGVNKVNSKPIVSIKQFEPIVGLDTITETGSVDTGDDCFFYLDLDTTTRSFKDDSDQV